MAQGMIRIGVIATLVGPLSAMGEEGVRAVNLAVAEFGGKVANKRIALYVESSNAIPDSAVHAAQTLLRDGVDFIIGPLSGNEGLAIRDFAKEHPNVTFINGVSGAQDLTLRNPAPNFFSFSTNGVQFVAGLGRYAYEELGYRRVATVAEDYSYPHGQVGGFVIEYCRAGGQIVDRLWVHLGKIDFSAIIASIPTDIDALFVTLAGADSVKFLEQYYQAGGSVPLLGGTNTLDQYVLSTAGNYADKLIGLTSAGPVASENPDPEWQRFTAAYNKQFPDALQYPSHITYGYYVNTKAALLALGQINGDLSDGQARFQETLASLEFYSPTGPVRLDHNRNAIANIFITEVAQKPDGSLYSRIVRIIPEVNQTLGIDEEEYLSYGIFNRDNPACFQ